MGLVEQLVLMRMWYLAPTMADALTCACAPFLALQLLLMWPPRWLSEAHARAVMLGVMGFNLGLLVVPPQTSFAPFDALLVAVNVALASMAALALQAPLLNPDKSH